MLRLIKQSTSFGLKIGPFVDATDGSTAETGLSIGASDIRISKDGTAFAAKDSGGATHDENGWYTISLGSADTDTLGELIIAIDVSGARPVTRSYSVVPANVYDSLISGSDLLQIDVRELDDIFGAAGNIDEFFINWFNPGDGSIHARLAGDLDGDVNGALTSYDAAEGGSSTLRANNSDDEKIAAASVQPDNKPTVDSNGHTEAVDSEGNHLSSPLSQGTAQSGTGTTITLASGESSQNQQYRDQRIGIRAGTGAGQSRIITDYNGSTKVATVDEAWLTNPDATSEYEINGGKVELARTTHEGATIATVTDVTNGVTLASSENVYHADIVLLRDTGSGRDEYTVTWFKNGNRVTSGITSPTIQVIKRADGTDLVASTAMTEIGSTASYKYNESSNKVSSRESAIVIVTATIDSATRSFARVVS